MIFSHFSIARYAVLINAINSIRWSAFAVTDVLTTVQKNSLYIQNLRAFLDYTPKISEDQDGFRLPEGPAPLTLHGVSFRYKGKKKMFCTIFP